MRLSIRKTPTGQDAERQQQRASQRPLHEAEVDERGDEILVHDHAALGPVFVVAAVVRLAVVVMMVMIMTIVCVPVIVPMIVPA